MGTIDFTLPVPITKGQNQLCNSFGYVHCMTMFVCSNFKVYNVTTPNNRFQSMSNVIIGNKITYVIVMSCVVLFIVNINK